MKIKNKINNDKCELHNQGNICKGICLFASKTFGLEHKKSFQGWCELEQIFDDETNFCALLYEKNTKYIICFLGTERTSLKDHIANLKMGLVGKNKQMIEADRYFKSKAKQYNFNSSNTLLVGHSEGGTEATYVAIKNDINAFTFNAFGISKKIFDESVDYSDLIINYRDNYDPVSAVKSNIGTTYVLKPMQKILFAITPIGMLLSHRLENMSDCNNVKYSFRI
ncbi:MAG: Mbeg1-like protein [Candidatus Gastranaerophilales bacterium]